MIIEPSDGLQVRLIDKLATSSLGKNSRPSDTQTREAIEKRLGFKGDGFFFEHHTTPLTRLRVSNLWSLAASIRDFM